MPRPGTLTVDPRMLPQIRAASAAAMVDECQISKPNPAGRTYDPEAKRTTGGTTLVREGATYVQALPRNQSAAGEVGGEATTQRDYYAAVPIEWDDVETGQTFKVTKVSAAGDPRLLDRVFKIAAVTVDSFAAQRDLALEEIGRG